MKTEQVMTLCAVAVFFITLSIYVWAYVVAASCPSGQKAVKNIFDWPVCVDAG